MLVLANAKVLGFDGVVDVHVAGGRIAAVGPRSLVRRPAPKATVRAVDLEGARLLPSFVDSHVHLKPWALGMRQVALAGERDLANAVATVRASAARLPPGAWVLGGGWEKELLGREPTARDLAGIEAPVAIESRDGHALWCNEAALAAAGILPGTPDPPGGRIVREAGGAPAGILYETARAPVFRAQPPPSRAEVEETLAIAFRKLLALGISEVHDCSYRAQDSCFADLELLEARGRLPIRVAVAFPGDALDEALDAGRPSGWGSPRLRRGGLKQLTDGTLGSQTAAMEEPYCGGSGTGLLCIPSDELRENVKRAAGAGIATWFHVIGDRCLRVVLDALEAAPRCLLPHRIEHAQLTPPPLLARAAELGVTMSVQPSHLLSDMELARRLWGERTRHAYAYGAMRRAGLPLAFGSDVPVEGADPFVGLLAAVRRAHPAGGDPFHPDEAIPVEAAIEAYTAGGANAGPWASEKGRIEAGQLADLVVVAPDPLAVAPDELGRCRVVRHLVDGIEVALG